MPLIVSSVALVAALVLGGATYGGLLQDAVLQLVSIPLLLVSGWRLLDAPLARSTRWALALCLGVVLMPLAQLVPLPPQVWTSLPNRDLSAAAYELLGRETPWMPLSISPRATWLALLSLLPPCAIFLATVSLDYSERRRLSLVVLAVGAIEVLVAFLQFSQGPESPLRFFDTNSEIAGFFANRNHFAALLYAVLLLAAVWAIDTTRRATGPRGTQWVFRSSALAWVLASFTLVVIFIAAQAMVRSRAGLGLTILALLGAGALAVIPRREHAITPARLLAAATALALVFTAQFALYRVLDRFAEQSLAEDARLTIARNTLELAWAYMPLGSGAGTFITAYGMAERPEDALPNTFVNRAHNDVLEVGLEAGVLGLGLMALFGTWFVMRAVQVWRRPFPGLDLDRSLACAATLIVVLLVAHSLVDYPLRSGAVMAVLAFACALLVDPPLAVVNEGRRGEGGLRNALPSSAPAAGAVALTGTRSLSASAPSRHPVPGLASGPPGGPGERWGAEVMWPEEWRTVDGHSTRASSGHNKEAE